MNIKEIKKNQENKLREICISKGINFQSLYSLLDSVKTKKLLRRNNYHQQKINDLIEKEIK